MSTEYPKAIYSVDGKMAIVPTKDVEAAQWEEWGQTAPDDAEDLPLDLSNKPVFDDKAPLPGDIDHPLDQADTDDLDVKAEPSSDVPSTGPNGVAAIEEPGKPAPEPEEVKPAGA